MLRISPLKNAGKPRDRKSIPSPLPVELWIEILKIAIYSTLPISETCTSDDFPKVLYRWRSMPMTYRRYRQLKVPSIHDPTTKNLRLVCRAWFNIIHDLDKHRPSLLPRQHPARFIAANGRLVHSLPTFDKMALLDKPLQVIKPYPLQKDLLSFGSNISTLLYSPRDLWCYSTRIDKDALSFLVKNSQYFPNLHSLSLEDHVMDLDFFTDIEKGFPQLKSFQLSRCMVKGDSFHRPTFSLPNLEIAEFDVQGYPPKCSFPALRHLSLNLPYEYRPFQPLRDHFPQLESFVDRSDFTGPTFSSLASNIHNLDNLILLGARTHAIRPEIRSIAREFSPRLKHIWILDWIEETLETIRVILKSFKKLTHLTINTRYISYTSPPQLQDIRLKCKERGIQLVEIAEM